MAKPNQVANRAQRCCFTLYGAAWQSQESTCHIRHAFALLWLINAFCTHELVRHD